jgi:hypothetical protein
LLAGRSPPLKQAKNNRQDKIAVAAQGLCPLLPIGIFLQQVEFPANKYSVCLKLNHFFRRIMLWRSLIRRRIWRRFVTILHCFQRSSQQTRANPESAVLLIHSDISSLVARCLDRHDSSFPAESIF